MQPRLVAAELDQVAHHEGADVLLLGVGRAPLRDDVHGPVERRRVAGLVERLSGAQLLFRVGVVELLAQLLLRGVVGEADGERPQGGLLGVRVLASLGEPAQRLDGARIARPAESGGGTPKVGFVGFPWL